LDSNLNHDLPADEELIPVSGNPHPHDNNQHDNFPGHFEDVGDLDQVHQANVDQGWVEP